MTCFTTADGARLFFKDWGAGQPILFAHGWPLSSEADRLDADVLSLIRA